jgi:Zn-dependent alcohol dehydrogenase
MLTRDKVKELVSHMPESFTADDLIEKIILLQKIEQARDEVSRGEVYDEEDIDKMFDTWQL